ncbi:MAG: hypothetical protein JO099_17035 [Acidobacteriia bacterium]|nr:hypothetical protein [Terriglobia bacterium]
MRAYIVGPFECDWTQHRHHLFATRLVKTRLPAAVTRHCWFRFGRLVQQMFQHFRAELMARGAGGHLDSFQIELTALVQAREDNLQQRSYFTRRFLLDRLGRFFSCSVSESSTGRARQIFSLTSSNSRLNWRN